VATKAKAAAQQHHLAAAAGKWGKYLDSTAMILSLHGCG
jgi:hypothetical protein